MNAWTPAREVSSGRTISLERKRLEGVLGLKYCHAKSWGYPFKKLSRVTKEIVQQLPVLNLLRINRRNQAPEL